MSVLEYYVNTRSEPASSWPRWLVDGHGIVMGGSIVSSFDWRHVSTTYGCGACLNIDASRSDKGLVPDAELCEFSVEYDRPIPSSALVLACRVAEEVFAKESRIYLHCHHGRSRSPAFAYAILRKVRGLRPLEALSAIDSSSPHGEYATPGYSGRGSWLVSVEDWMCS